MVLAVSTYTLIVLAGAVVSLSVAVASLRNRPDPMAWPLAALMIGASLWAIPHGISLEVSTPEYVVVLHQFRYFGTVLVPLAYLAVSLQYSGRTEYLTYRIFGLLSIIPAITLLVVWTNDLHGWFWQETSVETVNGASVLLTENGIWFLLHVGYSYALVVVSLLVLADVFVRSGPIYRKQSLLMLVGGAVPLGVNFVVNFGTDMGARIDFSTTALAVTGVLFALALFYFDLLNVRPVARDLLFEQIDDGVIVVGPDDRIVDANSVATDVFDVMVGERAPKTLPEEINADGGDLVVETEGTRRVFRTRSTELTDGFGRESGRIVYLSDVTDLAVREQRLSVLNRVLQHNIRNEMSVVAGYLETIDEESTNGIDEYVDHARESADHIVDLSDKARTLERTIQQSSSNAPIAVTDTVERVVERALEAELGVEIDTELPPSSERAQVRAAIIDEELFEAALTNLLENAIEHNDTDCPQVTLSIESDSENVRVTVADNGPGIPDSELRVLETRTETPLDHGSGIGLWLVKWTASLSGGELSFTEAESRGSVVTLTFDRVTGS